MNGTGFDDERPSGGVERGKPETHPDGDARTAISTLLHLQVDIRPIERPGRVAGQKVDASLIRDHVSRILDLPAYPAQAHNDQHQ